MRTDTSSRSGPAHVGVDGVRKIVLLGFMAAGKSTVAALLAERLGWEWLDLDREIERREGRGVPRIFRESGEAHFREREVAVTRELSSRSRLVLSPGGGWITNPGALALLGGGTFSAWLRISPEAALRRAEAAPGARPLLSGPDPLERVRRLLEEREPLYSVADSTVETDGRYADEVAREIEQLVRAQGLTSEAKR